MLSERMVQDLKLRLYSPHTVRAYVGCMQRFVDFHGGRSPMKLGTEHVREFLLYRTEQEEVAPATSHMCVASIKFFYRVTLKRPEVVADIPWPKPRRRLPPILAPAEVESLLGHLGLMHRAMAAVAYGAGLRIGELCTLEVGDIDSERMVINVRAGKGAKDRLVLLSPDLLAHLRAYWRIRQPPGSFLFPGWRPDSHVTPEAVRKAFRVAGQAAGIKQRVTPHLLRHTFATHLLEMGTALPVIQALLGHADPDTTHRYTQVRARYLATVKSPFDALHLPEVKPL